MNRFLTLVACATLVSLTSCGQPDKPAAGPPQAKPAANEKSPAHAPHGAGPHGGTLTDWGGGAYHVEFTVDHDKQEATVYLVGSDEKSPAPIKAESIHLVINDPPTELDLAAKPLEGEAAGVSSRFVGMHENLGKIQEFAGTISGEIEGTPYTGDFKEEPHSAGHKH